jgi:transcription initiation factor TFIID subunit 2
VDPELLGIPTYFDVIPRKDARDLRTIRQKLDSDKYDSIQAFEADTDLMIRNAITFNGADSEVGKIAEMLGTRMSELLANAKAGPSKKRKDGDGKGTPQPTKKAKLA